MKHTKLFIIILALFISSSAVAQQDSAATTETLKWYTNAIEAHQVSQATNKPIFAFFTGSDWCGWCKKLQREVFAKPAFIEWANKNVVLLELDFPRYKAQDPELAQQNAGLQQAFRVGGYPTVWLFTMNQDSAEQKFNIMALGSCGYPSGAEKGKEEVKFLSNVNAILEKKTVQNTPAGN